MRMLLDELAVPLSFTLAGMLLLSLWGTDMTYFYAIYFVTVVSYLELARRLFGFRSFSERELVGLFALGLALRLMFLRLPTSLSVDVVSYFSWVKSIGTGLVPNVGNIYGYPYPPAFGYLLKLLSFFQIGPLAFRGLMIAADVLTAYLIRRLTMTLWHVRKAADVAAVAYLFFPPAIIESGWNGHFEPLVNSVALIALILSMQQKSIRAGIGSAIAIGLKAYPALFTLGDLALLSRRGWKAFTLSLFLTLSLIIAPVAYYGGISSVTKMLQGVAAIPTGGGGSSELIYVGGIFQYLAGSSVALVRYVQLMSAVGISTALLIALNVRRWRRSIVLMFLVWLGALAELYGFVRFANNSASDLLVIGVPSIPTYWFVPPALSFSLAALFVVVGALLLVTARRIRTERSRLRLLFVGLSLAGAIAVMNFSVLEGWYIFFFVPLVFVIMPRRYVLPLVMFSLILYSAPYTSANFQSIGAVANTSSILPTTLKYTAINHLGPDLSAEAFNISWRRSNPSAHQGEIKSVGNMACFLTHLGYTYSWYSINVDVNQSQHPDLLLMGNSSLTNFRVEFWNNSKGIAYWVPKSPEGPQYIDTTILTGSTGFNRVVIVNLRPFGQWQCLDDLEFLPHVKANTITLGTSLGLVLASQKLVAFSGASNGYAALLMNVTHDVGTSDILTINLEANYNSVVEIGVLYNNRQHNWTYTASREFGELNNFTFTPYSISLSEIAHTKILGIIITVYPTNSQNSTQSVFVNLLQFSEYVQTLNIVTLIGAATSLCAVLIVGTSMFPKKPRRSRDHSEQGDCQGNQRLSACGAPDAFSSREA